jgi:hypothetical protein
MMPGLMRDLVDDLKMVWRELPAVPAVMLVLFVLSLGLKVSVSRTGDLEDATREVRVMVALEEKAVEVDVPVGDVGRVLREMKMCVTNAMQVGCDDSGDDRA